jgi:hypothetical protein
MITGWGSRCYSATLLHFGHEFCEVSSPIFKLVLNNEGVLHGERWQNACLEGLTRMRRIAGFARGLSGFPAKSTGFEVTSN